MVAFTEFFGADEALREANRKLTSPVTSATPAHEWQPEIAAAVAIVERAAHAAPIDKIDVEFKGKQPLITIFTGKRGGGEDRKFVIDARRGTLLRTEAYTDKPFLYRLHSGEAFGDGGLVLAMLWGLALALLGLSGVYIFFSMRPRRHETALADAP